MKQRVHLICNAHLDPVWQWEWEEGAAAAVSTFRAAADFCQETSDFLFCHNEAVLYRWVEEYEPSLFARIRELVRAGRWHIMGGWYLQPDCNMPSGESILRQLRQGRAYFQEKFGVTPTVAVNVDPFGHSRGLVQILTRAGYTGYLFMRPTELALPGNDFRWVGFDGSQLMAHRLDTNYNSPLGGARAKAEAWLAEHGDLALGMIPWGVGNHGGGPSRQDIADLNALRAERTDVTLLHSTPEDYFAELAAGATALPQVARSLQPCNVGCYTSQIRIKQRHRQLEGALAVAERMCAHGAMTGRMAYPAGELEEAERALCFAQFHDILPGTSIQPAEEAALRGLDHGLELATRLRARAFFALAAGQERARPGEIPVLAYNPHPYPVEDAYHCEFMLADQNWKEEFTLPRIYDGDGAELPSQVEKEDSNLNLDWRKRVVFRATLPPFSVRRFVCRMEILPRKPVPCCAQEGDCYVLRTETMAVAIGKATGLLEQYTVRGADCLLPGSGQALLMRDCADPWEMRTMSFRTPDSVFALASPEDCARVCGVGVPALEPVHVIEDGPVRTVIEAVFRCRDSVLVTRYLLPKKGAQVELRLRVRFGEADRMLKLSLRTPFGTRYLGETMFGTDTLPTDGTEAVAQRWTAAVGDGKALTVLNDGVYGSDFSAGEVRLSLLRSAAYTAHPIGERPLLPQDRLSPRMEQGERTYTLRLEGGPASERLERVGREACAFAEAPYLLSFFPTGDARPAEPPLCSLSGDAVELTALRRACDGDGWILRLFEPTGAPHTAVVSFPGAGVSRSVSLGSFEIRTLRYVPETGALTEAEICD